MFKCAVSKLTLFYHSKPSSGCNQLRQCVALLTPKSDFSTSSNLLAKNDDKPSHWLSFNDIVYPPQEPGEERRAAVC